MKRILRRLLSPYLLALLAACGGGGGGGSASSGSAPVTPSSNIQQTINAASNALNGIDIGTTGDSDLAAFGDAVGSHSIVLLTEPTHGDGGTFTLKARLVKYLHENMGFNVLFMESGMYDLARMAQRTAAGGDSASVQGPGRVYYMYSETAQGQEVLQYVDSTRPTAQPLALWGHDVQMAGVDSINTAVPDLQAFLTANGSALPASADWPGYQRVAQQVVALNGNTLAAADATSFLNMSSQATAELCAMPDSNSVDLFQSAGFWCRIATGIQADYSHLFSATDPRTPTDLRDLAGAGNIEWLLNGRLKGQKTIVWLHALHGFNGLSGTNSCVLADSQECGPGWTNVGTNLVKAFSDQVYIVHITAGQGIFGAFADSPCGTPLPGVALPALGSSMLESYLAASGKASFIPYPADAATRGTLAGLSIFEVN
jgi:erythromycin esterase-like protein